jgi:hypothetical protein
MANTRAWPLLRRLLGLRLLMLRLLMLRLLMLLGLSRLLPWMLGA